MRIPFFRIWYSTTYSVLFLLLVVLLAVTPGDLVYQAVRNRNYPNAIVVGAVCVLTLLITVCIYATRLYTNRTLLANIPKSYIPIEQGEIGKHIRRMIVKGFERSALIAWDSRPRDVRLELRDEREGSTAPSHERSLKKKGRSHDVTAIPVDPEMPPWGHISHPGWASPAMDGVPNLQFCNVIAELPNLIEAKAVSLAPPDPAFAFHMSLDGVPVMPDARIVALLQRPSAMGLRDYLGHLSSFGLINPPELGTAFIMRYEYARFSTQPITEVQFQELMAMFAEILTGMTELAPELVAELQHDDYSSSSDTASLAPSQISSTSGSSTGSAIHYKTPRTMPYAESVYTRSTTSTAEMSESNGTLRTAPSHFYDYSSENVPVPRTPSIASQHSSSRSTPMPRTAYSAIPPSTANSSTSSLRSARSVIRLTPNPGPGELPYYFDVQNG
ncbi:sucrase/ferredoxin domain containing protein [Macrophomina phaseolina MS6]|uniref:Defect at low temperature protein 1 n=1 Tax=Macrophomina phaseolina (strain MS6) TaxID=1126212 RepID=K2RK70_MACPH|nr:sucrase/ferredoxin domain containing protein [Macrophomina phaseolina MS6]